MLQRRQKLSDIRNIYISRIFNESLVTLTVSRSELSRSMQLNPINFDRAYASSLTIRPLYKEIILVIGVGGGSHVFRWERRRRNALRELLQPWQLHLRKVRSVGHDDSRRLADGTKRQRVMLIPMNDIVVVVVVLSDDASFSSEMM